MRKTGRAVTRLAAACLAFQAAVSPGVRAAGPADPILVGAGGIASCQSQGDEATARLLDGISGTVFTAGDNAYEQGKATEWANCYGPSWGRHKARTRPAAGNHDWATANGGPYFDYFGAAAGRRGEGWYSYDLGAWHVVVLNSNCPGGCGAGSRQERWLRADLAASRARCTLAVIHHPRFSSDAVEGSQPRVAAFWEALYQAGADLVISGHARVYERMVPQNPAGKADPAYGLRLINVGTGGRGHVGFVSKPLANSAVRNNTSFGVLKLTLHPQDYQWAFVPVAGARFTDTGSGSCHGKPGGPRTDQLTFSAQADTHVIKAKPDSNYGAERSVLVDGEPVAESYLRFSVTGVNGTVTRARLRLWVTDGSADGPAVYPTALTVGTAVTPWAETGITWNRRPGRTGPALDDRAVTTAGQFVDYDVSGVVAGNGAYSFDLAGGAKDGILFASREVATAAERPRLLLEVVPGG